MGATLSVQPASAVPFEVAIGNTATIGRTRENTVCLSFSPQVSRQHAMIRCHNGYQYQIIDLGSRNGTFVNDQRVVMPVTLRAGDQIRIADNLLTLREAPMDGSSEQQLTVAGSVAADFLEARPVALLVCDIRGFSSMSEKMASGDLAQVLGVWFRELGNLVAMSGGTIDKFIGDAVLAYWGVGEGAIHCAAAFDTAKKIRALAEHRQWPCGDKFEVVIALHHGKVTCSNVGVAAERDATIIGDAVNTVFRLESLSKEVEQGLVLSEDIVQHLSGKGSFTDLGSRELKGKKQLVKVFGGGH
jgi:adenylate cyclase